MGMYSLSRVGSGGWTEKNSSPRARMRSPPSLCRTWNRPSSSMRFSVPASFSVFTGSSSSHVWTRLPAGNWSRRNSSHSFDKSCMMVYLLFCRKCKGRLPKREPAFNGVSAHVLSSLIVHSPFPSLGKHTTYHSVPVISSSFFTSAAWASGSDFAPATAGDRPPPRYPDPHYR